VEKNDATIKILQGPKFDFLEFIIGNYWRCFLFLPIPFWVLKKSMLLERKNRVLLEMLLANYCISGPIDRLQSIHVTNNMLYY
jgi:hypothetical protein